METVDMLEVYNELEPKVFMLDHEDCISPNAKVKVCMPGFSDIMLPSDEDHEYYVTGYDTYFEAAFRETIKYMESVLKATLNDEDRDYVHDTLSEYADVWDIEKYQEKAFKILW